jgi:flagellar basal body rod protein FlgG
MIRAFYSGAAGMRAQQTSVDVVSNNIANLNTTGYKETDAQFEDLLYTSMAGGAQAGAGRLLSGSGEKLVSTKSDMSAGTAQQTGRALDFCIAGDGYFALEDGAGNRTYTRAGSFQASAATGMYLTDSEGRYVLDGAGNRIRSTNGTLSAAPGVYGFANETGLAAAGGGCFAATAASGAAAPTAATVRAGYLEASNVDLASQMSRLILAQRGYQLSGKVVQNADEVEGMVSTLGQ